MLMGASRRRKQPHPRHRRLCVRRRADHDPIAVMPEFFFKVALFLPQMKPWIHLSLSVSLVLLSPQDLIVGKVFSDSRSFRALPRTPGGLPPEPVEFCYTHACTMSRRARSARISCGWLLTFQPRTHTRPAPRCKGSPQILCTRPPQRPRGMGPAYSRLCGRRASPSEERERPGGRWMTAPQ
jgi:hypothetical protein